MDLSNPFSYVREECLLLDLSLAHLCRRADVSRSTFYRWEEMPPASILMLARLENALRRERIAGGRDALDRAAFLLNSLRSNPQAQTEIHARLNLLINELNRIYGPR